jgi:ubiquinone/menaquinone biosynthesis C-methylase UbiE
MLRLRKLRRKALISAILIVLWHNCGTSALKETFDKINRVHTTISPENLEHETLVQWTIDPVLACPITKRPLAVQLKQSRTIEKSTSGVDVRFTTITSRKKEATSHYKGRTDTYYNLLSSVKDASENDGTLHIAAPHFLKQNLFKSPVVSFLYERGWRQRFTIFDFPGAEKEFQMANSFFMLSRTGHVTRRPSVLVDMSCATGLFTRRFASSGLYDRVIGCDYSDSMLREARRRIRFDSKLQSQRALYNTTLELVQCDVAAIPMQSNSVDFVNAGAAMHCWPDVSKGLSEIHRVLRRGGKFFASTFLMSRFPIAQKRFHTLFHDFESNEKVEQLLQYAGFTKVSVEILGMGCVIIRCEK